MTPYQQAELKNLYKNMYQSIEDAFDKYNSKKDSYFPYQAILDEFLKNITVKACRELFFQSVERHTDAECSKTIDIIWLVFLQEFFKLTSGIT